VTGAPSDIDRAVAETFASEGARDWLADIDSPGRRGEPRSVVYSPGKAAATMTLSPA
jgi:NAD(P)-dependent dehydrogenase (short-subunit alcohol dehydrogenase family)